MKNHDTYVNPKKKFHIDFLSDSLFGFFVSVVCIRWFCQTNQLRFAVLGRHMQPLRSRVARWKLPPQLSSLHLRSHGGLSVRSVELGGWRSHGHDIGHGHDEI